jgi:DNA repair protein SbcC/Rad50
MRPLALSLQGFRGIRDGLGLESLTLDFERLAGDAQLVGLVGANGRGKSTIMDNMTPFTAMPSRAAVAGPGGFSYYDHVFLPESIKDLTWSHEGRRYRSQIVIRLNGSKRRTEAFLHVIDEHGHWKPVRLADGTVSDGKVETYNQCVESICGSAGTFFTSVFSAQGKRPLIAYRNAEIKTLLADLLGQEEIRVLGQKAGETARLLKAGLSAIRQEQTGFAEESRRVEAAQQRLDGAALRVHSAENAKQAAQTALDAALARHARLAVEREQSRAIEARRAQLMAERRSVLDTAAPTARTLQAQDQSERQRLARLDQRVAGRLQQERARRQALGQSRLRCLQVLAEAEGARRAVRRLALAQHLQELRNARTLASRKCAQELAQSQAAMRLAEQKMAGIEREAGKAVLQAEELARRFGLAGEVPCVGTNLQERCKLLGDAHRAQALVPSAKAQVARLAREKAQAQQDLMAARQRCKALADAPTATAWAEHREAVARERAGRLAVLASKEPACAQARTMLAEIDRDLAALGLELPGVAETVEERTERRQIGASRQAIAQQLDLQSQQTAAALARLDQALAALPPAYDEQQLSAAVQALCNVRETLAAAERSLLAAVRDMQALEELSKQSAALAARRDQVRDRCVHVENELANWNLLVRCMSNDGLIALAIDDAGPALSALANDLLLACYGPRFTVAIHTLVETVKGEQKEGFDIVVHDGETGDSKSVALLSGGERNFVESCLTRAIALYLAQNSGRRYSTLFSDEADGPLDPLRKRMFMAMKREVLRLGGYEQEYFISQTPELLTLADAVIDLDRLHSQGNGQAEEAVARAGV